LLDSNASTAAKKADAHHQHAQYVGETDAQVDIQGLQIKEELLLLHVAASIAAPSAHCKMSCRFDFPCFATK